MANRRQGQVTEGLVALQSQGVSPAVDGEPLKKAGAPEVGPSSARVRATTWLCVGWRGSCRPCTWMWGPGLCPECGAAARVQVGQEGA